MASKCERSGSTLIAMPWNDTQRRSRTPMAAILSSKSAPLSGRLTQTPTRSSRRSPRTLNAASVRMIHSSSAAAPPPPLAADIERGELPDDPFLQRRHKGADIWLPPLQVQHYIGHPLA